MNENKNKYKINNIVFIIIGITSIFLLIINFIPIFVIDAGIESRFTNVIYSDSETYVNKSNPDKNYADSYDLYIGKFSEIYIHFDLEKLPRRTEDLYFFLHGFGFDYNVESAVDDIEINVILIESNWTASKITWNSKPKLEEIIATVNITDIIQSRYIAKYNFERAIKITEILKEDEIREISLCLNITENNEKLNASALIGEFGLIWTYENVILSYTPIISTFILLLLLIGIIYFLRKDLFNCRDCGSKRNLEDKYCRSCGSSIKENILIKSRDYKLLLIILLVFIFLEISFISIRFALTTGPFMFFIALPILLWVIFCLRQIKKKINEYKKLNSNLKQA